MSTPGAYGLGYCDGWLRYKQGGVRVARGVRARYVQAREGRRVAKGCWFLVLPAASAGHDGLGNVLVVVLGLVVSHWVPDPAVDALGVVREEVA